MINLGLHAATRLHYYQTPLTDFGSLIVMRTFSIQTLGCKVNQYESEQMASLLRSRGLQQVDAPAGDVRIVNTCSVTIQAGTKSRQTIRRSVALPVLAGATEFESAIEAPHVHAGLRAEDRPRVIVTGCWATSDKSKAAAMPGVDAVITHHDDVAAELDRLLGHWLSNWKNQHSAKTSPTTADHTSRFESSPGLEADKGWIIKAGTQGAKLVGHIRSFQNETVNEKARISASGGVFLTPGLRYSEDPDFSRTDPGLRRTSDPASRGRGTTALPLLGEHQTGRQRALLKIQDGCDAHCTYCIIPNLRPNLWSKSTDDVVEEARRLVDSGHVEIVLTGIFLGAYGQETALRRRQPGCAKTPLAELIDSLCTRVPWLGRLRLSSLEPGDLTADLISVLKSHPQIVPHFHLPLQSGSDALLRKMNRQYTRDDFLRMVDQVNEAFDRPALTTDIIVGFPGETDAEFDRTVEIVDRARFIHTHAFSFSPRPGTAAARWSRDFVRGPIVNQRIEFLQARASEHSFEFRREFVGQEVTLLVERNNSANSLRHGRCERYFEVYFESDTARDGDFVRVRIDTVTPHRTMGTLM
jgi:MiaB/RimO family radical SAM methylthiotransferase